MYRQFDRRVFLELAKLAKSYKAIRIYFKNYARVYKKEQRLQTLSR